MSMPSAPERTNEVFSSMPAGSDAAIIAFSSHGTKPGYFDFFRLGEFFPDTSKLLVRDPSDNWYNAGLPGVGETVEEIAEWIRAELDTIGAQRLITLGHSMGGYAALLFGCLIGAERVVALSPQTLLDHDLPIWSPPPDVPLQVPDLVPVLRSAPGTAVDLVIGLDELFDVFHSQRVVPIPSVRVLGVGDARHGLGSQIDRDEYWGRVTALLQRETPASCEVEPGFPAGVGELIEDAALAFRRLGAKAALKKLVHLCHAYPDWPAPHFAVAKVLGAFGHLPPEVVKMVKEVRDNPGWTRPSRKLAARLRDQGRLAEAEVLLPA